MNYKSGGLGEVELGLGRQVMVGQLLTTGQISSGVQQQLHIQAGPDDRVMEVQISEHITFLGWRRSKSKGKREKKESERKNHGHC